MLYLDNDSPGTNENLKRAACLVSRKWCTGPQRWVKFEASKVTHVEYQCSALSERGSQRQFHCYSIGEPVEMDVMVKRVHHT